MFDEVGPEIGRRLRAYRKSKKVSLVTLADQLGIGRGNLWALEKGRTAAPTIVTVLRASHLLGIDFHDLLRPAGEAERHMVFGRPFEHLTDEDRASILEFCDHLEQKRAASARLDATE